MTILAQGKELAKLRREDPSCDLSFVRNTRNVITSLSKTDHIRVERWAARSDLVEEFLKAMVLEEVLSVEDLSARFSATVGSGWW